MESSSLKSKQLNGSVKKTNTTDIGSHVGKYISSLTKLRPTLDAKFNSNNSAVANLNKLKLNVQPYKYEELTDITNKLFKIEPCAAYKYLNNERHSKLIDMVDGFARGVSNIINSRYQQKYKVSNAYVKLWEIYETFDWLIPKNSKEVNFFHMAEAPGQWINTTKHYFYQHIHDKTQYNWLANTLNPKHPRMKGIINGLPDTYGFIKQNPKKWLYGADGSGDITLPENIMWFNKFLTQAMPGKLNVITGDAGTNPIDTNLELLQRIDIAQAIVVACTARQGSNCVIKQFLPHLKSKPASEMADGFFMSFMYLYHILFTEFHMFKPLASSPGSGEFYVVARGFHGITHGQRQLLLDYLGKFSVNKPMFAKTDIPNVFSDKVCRFINDLHIVNIKNNEVSCEIINYCYSNSNKSNKQDNKCDTFMAYPKIKAQKQQDLERYLDKYRIARTDKLRFVSKTKKHTKNIKKNIISNKITNKRPNKIINKSK